MTTPESNHARDARGKKPRSVKALGSQSIAPPPLIGGCNLRDEADSNTNEAEMVDLLLVSNTPTCAPEFIQVDWVSFTVNVAMAVQAENEPPERFVARALEWLQKHVAARVVLEAFAESVVGPKRGGYVAQLWNAAVGSRLLYDDQEPYWVVEFTGAGCDWLRERNFMKSLLREVWQNVTRIDLAADYPRDAVTVDQVGWLPYSKYPYTRVHIESAEGETFYLGSMKSERFTRIYAYNLPHPRAGEVRVEFVYRKPHAPKVASAVADGLIAETVKAAMKRVGVIEKLWPSVGTMPEPRGGRRGSRTVAGRLRWLLGSVAPSLKSMIDRGEVTLSEFLEVLDAEPASDDNKST